MHCDTAVIGAGITGLTAASELAGAGVPPRVFDKSRGIGGRLATRRTDVGAFDHGAPQIDITSREFDVWLRGIGAVPSAGCVRGAPGMSRVLRPLTGGLEIYGEFEVAEVRGVPGAWWLSDRAGARHGPFAAVILAIPAPQAARLLPAGGFGALSRVTMAPVWTLMAAYGDRIAAPDILHGQGVLDLVRRQDGDGTGPDRWVAHMGREESRVRVDRDKADMLPELLGLLSETLGTAASPVHAAAHRWRFARTSGPLGRAFLGDPAQGLLAGGDWALGDRAEHGWRSGLAMAKALLSAGIESR